LFSPKLRFINLDMKLMGRKTVKGRTTSAPKTAKTPTLTTVQAPSPISAATLEMADPKGAPTHDEIARRSYELFLARGGQAGHEVEDWLSAERELGSS
jgi:hypothetical protein